MAVDQVTESSPYAAEPAEPSGDAFVDMLANDPPPGRTSVMADILEQRFEETRRLARRPAPQRWERWVEDGSFEGGHWELIEGQG